jgi:hypothetical protein
MGNTENLERNVFTKKIIFNFSNGQLEDDKQRAL